MSDMQNRIITGIKHVGRVHDISLVDETQNVQKLQLTGLQGLETHDNITSIQQFGFVSSPPEGSKALAICLGGKNSNKIVFATHNPKLRPLNLKQGEVIVHDASDQSLYISVNGILVAANDKVDIKIGNKTILEVTSSGVAVTGDLTVSGNITAQGDVKGGGISLDSHTHIDSKGGITSAPH